MPRFADDVVLSTDEMATIRESCLPVLAHDTIAAWAWHVPHLGGRRQKGPDFNVIVSAVSGRGLLNYTTRHREQSTWGLLADALNSVVAELNRKRSEKGLPLIRTMEQAKEEKRQKLGRLMLYEQLASFRESALSNHNLIAVLEMLGYEAIPAKKGNAHWISRISHPTLTPTQTRKGFSGRGYLLVLDDLRQEVVEEIERRRTLHQDEPKPVRLVGASEKVTPVPATPSKKNVGEHKPIVTSPLPNYRATKQIQKQGDLGQPKELSRRPEPQHQVAATHSPVKTPHQQSIQTKVSAISKPTVTKSSNPPPQPRKELSAEEALNHLINNIGPGHYPPTTLEQGKTLLAALGCQCERTGDNKIRVQMPTGTAILIQDKTFALLGFAAIRAKLRSDKGSASTPEFCLDAAPDKEPTTEEAQIRRLGPLTPRWLTLWKYLDEREHREIWHDALATTGNFNTPTAERAENLVKALRARGVPKDFAQDLVYAHIRTDTTVVHMLERRIAEAATAVPASGKEQDQPLVPGSQITKPRPVKPSPPASTTPEYESTFFTKSTPSAPATRERSTAVTRKPFLDHGEAWDALIRTTSNNPPITGIEQMRAELGTTGHTWQDCDEANRRLRLVINGRPAQLALDKTLLLMQWAKIRKQAGDGPSFGATPLRLAGLAVKKSDLEAESKAIRTSKPTDECWRGLWDKMTEPQNKQTWRLALENTSHIDEPLERAKAIVASLIRGGFAKADAVNLILAHLDRNTELLYELERALHYDVRIATENRPKGSPPQSIFQDGTKQSQSPPPPNTITSGARGTELVGASTVTTVRKEDQPKVPDRPAGITPAVSPPRDHTPSSKRRRRPRTREEALEMLLAGIPVDLPPCQTKADLSRLLSFAGFDLIRLDLDKDALEVAMEDSALTMPLRKTILLLNFAAVRHALNDDPRAESCRSPDFDGLISGASQNELGELKILDPLSPRWRRLWDLARDPKTRDLWYGVLEKVSETAAPPLERAGEIARELVQGGLTSKQTIGLLLTHIRMDTQVLRPLHRELDRVTLLVEQRIGSADLSQARKPDAPLSGPGSR